MDERDRVERLCGCRMRARRVSGALVFQGTRVPVAALLENLKSGATADEFMEWFPGATRSQVEAVLGHKATAERVAALP